MSARTAGAHAESHRVSLPDPDWDLEGPTVLLGLRLLAWAIASGTAVFLPRETVPVAAWIVAVLTGSGVAALGWLVSRRRWTVLAEMVIVAQVGVWAFLMQLSGGPASPLFVGFLLEIALGAAWRGRRGGCIAAVAATAYVIGSTVIARSADSSRTFLSLGCLALTTVIAIGIAESLARQRARIADAHALLRRRAQNLADELRTLGDYLGSALIAIDDVGRVASVNRAALSLLGIDARAAISRPWQAVLGADDAGRAAISHVIAGGSSSSGVRFEVVAHGRVLPVHADLWSNPTADGTCTYVLLQPAADGESRPDNARRAAEAVACVTHQVRNALARLQGLLPEIGGAGPAAAPTASAVQSLIELCENVLAFDGPDSARMTNMSLTDTVTSAIALAGPPAAHVRVVAAAESIRVRAPRGPLVHAIFNLVDNACRATPEPDEVTVTVARDQDRVVVEVCDRGPGLPPGAASGRGAPGRGAGHGYGLLAARRFAETCGGRVEFDCPAAGGTRARLVLGAY